MTEAADWSAYWASTAERSACLPDVPEAVNAALSRFWQDRAAALPAQARVVDLCTGKGAVLFALHAARDDLHLEGYDYAAVSSDHASLILHGGQDCAALPLADRAIDAVTSQFGMEYTPDSAIEAARILRPNGQFAMIAHHRDSVLVAANAARRDALSAFCASGLFARAVTVARGGVAHDIDAIMANLAKDHAGQHVIAELFRALRQCVGLGAAGVPQIARLEAMAAAERQRLDAMANAALDEVGLNHLLAPIAARCALTIAPFHVDGHGIIAWQVYTV